LPIFLQARNDRLQQICDALRFFLEFSGRWDESLLLSKQAEERALAVLDFSSAGWRAYFAAWVYFLRGQADEALNWVDRCEAHWQKVVGEAREKAIAIRLRGRGHHVNKNYPAAIAAYQKSLELNRTLEAEGEDVARGLIWLGNAESDSGNHVAAERDFREALRIARNVNDQESITCCNSNMAALRLLQKDWPGAEELSREALTQAEEINRVEIIGESCYQLADALLQQGHRKEALQYARRAVDIYMKLRMPSQLEHAQATLKRCQEEGGS
jgi:tetratricopeptide (TPR) repeat protein